MTYILKPEKQEENLVHEMSEEELRETYGGGFTCFTLNRCVTLKQYDPTCPYFT